MEFDGEMLFNVSVEEAKARLVARGEQTAGIAETILDQTVYCRPGRRARTGLLKQIGVVENHSSETLCVEIGTAAPYGMFVEEGHQVEHTARSPKTAKRTPLSTEFGSFEVPARPFLRPALEMTSRDIDGEGL